MLKALSHSAGRRRVAGPHGTPRTPGRPARWRPAKRAGCLPAGCDGRGRESGLVHMAWLNPSALLRQPPMKQFPHNMPDIWMRHFGFVKRDG